MCRNYQPQLPPAGWLQPETAPYRDHLSRLAKIHLLVLLCTISSLLRLTWIRFRVVPTSWYYVFLSFLHSPSPIRLVSDAEWKTAGCSSALRLCWRLYITLLFATYNTPKKEITVISLISIFVRSKNTRSTKDSPKGSTKKTTAILGLGMVWWVRVLALQCKECSGLNENGFHRLLCLNIWF